MLGQASEIDDLRFYTEMTERYKSSSGLGGGRIYETAAKLTLFPECYRNSLGPGGLRSTR